MGNRLLDGFSDWESGRKTTQKQVTGNRLSSGFSEWESKQKKPAEVVSTKPSESQVAQIKPVDQVEHEMSFGQKLKSTMHGFMGTGASAIGMIGKAIESTGKAWRDPQESFTDKLNPVSTLSNAVGLSDAIKRAASPYLEKGGGKIAEVYEGASKKAFEHPDYNEALATFKDTEGKYDPVKFKDPWVYLNIVSQGTASFVPMAATLMATKSPVAAGMVGGLMEKGDAVQSFAESYAKQKGIEQDQLSNEDIQKIDTNANIYGAVSAVLESAFPGLLSKIVKEGGGNVIMNALKAIPFEGGTEGVQRFSQNLIGKVSGLSEEQILSEGVLDEAIAGALTGSAIAGVTSTLTPSIKEATPTENTDTASPIVTPDTTENTTDTNKVADIFDAIDSGDTEKIDKITSEMGKQELEQTKKILETIKEQSDTEPIPHDQLLEIEDHIEKIDDILGQKNDAISKKAIEIADGGVSESEVDTILNDSDKEEAIKTVKIIKEKLDSEKKDLLDEKAIVDSKEEKKQIQKEIDIIDESRHKIDNGLSMTYEEKSAKQRAESDTIIPPKEEGVQKRIKITLDDGRKVVADYTEKSGNTPGHFTFHGSATSGTGYKSDFFGDVPEGMSVEEAAKQRAEMHAKEQDSIDKNSNRLSKKNENVATKKNDKIEVSKLLTNVEKLTKDNKPDTIEPTKEKLYEPKTEQDRVSDTSDVQSSADLGRSGETPKNLPGHDGGSVPPQFGDGSSADRPNVSIATKRGRQAINEEIEAMLEMKEYSQNTDDYTSEEIALLHLYTGAGGKESVGAEGRGLLNEYYTPDNVIDKMWGIVQRLAPNAETAFEPSAGTGRIINRAPAYIKIDGAEISKVSGTIANLTNPDSNVSIGDFQELFFDTKTNKRLTPEQYDIVIGNPPFGDRAGFFKGKGEESNINRQEEYFIKRGLDMTKEGGYLVYVVNSSFLSKGKSAGKYRISKLGYLAEAYRLPENSFEDTSIGTDIVVFKKLGEETEDMSAARSMTLMDDKYFRAHPENVLGETKTRKNRFGKQESYVTGELGKGLEKMQSSQQVEEKKETVSENQASKGKKPVSIDTQNKKRVPKQRNSAPRKPDVQMVMPKENYEELVHPVVNVSKTGDSKEAKMLEKIDRDLSIQDPSESEKAVLNYQKGIYYPDVSYFSGEIYEKIEYLEKNKSDVISAIGEERYSKQLDGLKKVLPKEKTIQDINFDPIDRHIVDRETEKDGEHGSPITIKQAFKNYVLHGGVVLNPKVSKYDVLAYVLGKNAGKDVKKIMGFVKNDARRLFNDFMRNELNEKTQNIIVAEYNKQKNGYVRPKYSDFSIDVKNMAKEFRKKPFKMSKTQKEGVGFLVTKGSGVIAYGVGVGKTHTLAIATKANMDKGWTKRPLFIVPKSTLKETWLNTLHEMFPDLAINDLGGLQSPIVKRLVKDRGEDRKQWIKDGEMTVITHEGILRLGFNEEEIESLTSDLQDALHSEEMSTKKRGAEKSAEKMEEIIGKALSYATDTMFSDLGFDHISVDEVHNFRKIFQGAKPEKKAEVGGRKRFGNIIGGTPSKRAQQLFLISQQVQKNNKNRNVFLASATPFENQATEVYNILSLVARDRMKAMGIFNINDFFSAYAQFEVEVDRRLDGEWVNREKMKSFANLDSLQSLIKEFIDVQEDKTLVRPDRRVITPQLQMSEEQEKNLANIQAMLSGIEIGEGGEISLEKGKGDKEEGAFLKASTYSIANSVSPYFIKEYHPSIVPMKKVVDESPKIRYTLETIKKIKANKKTAGFGTFVFFGKMGVEYHKPLASHFAKELGYKDEEVVALSGKVTDEQKEKIKKDFNSGKIKVLFGGDQTKEGIDLQNNGFATINLALGWNPTQITQVEGRVWRQGNRRSIAPLIYPLVENSGDAMIYNKFEEKGGRLNDLYSYHGAIFDVGEIDPTEKKMALLTDPKDKANLQISMDTIALENDQVFYESKSRVIVDMINDIQDAKSNIEYYKKRISDLTEAGELASYQIENLKNYKKELKKNEDKLNRIASRSGGKTEDQLKLDIAELGEKTAAIKAKIANIKETLPSLLEKFTKEYHETVSKRKTMVDHMEEVQGLIDSVQERTEEEVTALKNSKIAEIESADSVAAYINNIGVQTIEKAIEKGKDILPDMTAYRIVMEVLDETNPTIASILQFKIAEKLMIGKKGARKEADGYFLSQKMLVALSKDMDTKQFEYVLRHELNHVAFVLLPRESQIEVERWYENLTPKEMLSIYDNDQEVIDSYMGRANGNIQNWDGTPMSPVTFMADETFNRYMNKKGDKKTAIQRSIRKIVSAIARLLNRINAVIFKNAKVDVATRKYAIQAMYNNVFTQNKNAFKIPAGLLKTMAERKVQFGDFDFEKEETPRASVTQEGQEVAAFQTSTPLIKNGRVSISKLYKKVYAELYEGKAPAMNTLAEEKIIRGMTKQSFTLGKRYATKLTKSTYKAINKEIKDYVIKNLSIADRGEFVRDIVNAKNAADTKRLIEKIDAKVIEVSLHKQLRKAVRNLIKAKNLQKDENLRLAMELPPIGKMTDEQLKLYYSTLYQFQKDDEFLSQRKIETVKNTELKGIKTLREAKERLAERSGKPVEAFENVTSTQFDRMRYDTALAESNPFYGIMVDDTAKEMLMREEEYLEIEEVTNDLIKKARNSRSMSLLDRAIPTDKRIYQYLSEKNKDEVSDELTNEEMEAALYIEAQYRRMYDYLVKNHMLGGSRFVDNYVTNLYRGFLEAWKSDGIGAAIREIFVSQQKQDAMFKIVSGNDTKTILPYEKFFQFAQFRSGVVKPTENVAKAFLTYTRTFQKKRAIDSLIPKLMIYVQALMPQEKTEGGLQKDTTLEKFVKEWINNKKGRKSDFGGVVPQGGKIDTALRIGNALVTILDIGANVSSGVASIGGEQATNYVMLGKNGYVRGTKRMFTKQGKSILAEHKAFTGKNPWTTLIEEADNIGNTTMKALFALFRASQVRANKQFLLGSLTNEEFATGEVSDERIAEIQRAMGRWRVVEDAKSIVGNTSFGSFATKYRTWAIPILRTTLADTKKIITDLKSGEGAQSFTTKEAREIGRVLCINAIIAVSIMVLFGDDDEDQGFTEKLTQKFVRDLLSTVGALNPKTFIIVPRFLQFMINFSIALEQLVTFEEYKRDGEGHEEGDLKAPNSLERLLTPQAIKQFK